VDKEATIIVTSPLA